MDENKSFNFSFRITTDEMKEILLGYLRGNGCISANEEKLFVGFHQKEGNGIVVEFNVPNKQA